MDRPQCLPLLIGCEDIVSTQTFEKINPATGQLLNTVSLCTPEHLERAVELGKKAQIIWAQKSAKERAIVLFKAAQLLRESNDRLAKIETEDTGRAIRETSVVDIVSAADCLEYMAAFIQTQRSDYIPLNGETFAYTRHQPVGLCLGIGAWNYPLQVATWKAAPALAAGNAMIFKPSELTPTSAYFLAKIFLKAGAPAGLFQVLYGQKEQGAMMVAHPSFDKISLTGSVPTGVRVAQSAAHHLKKVSLELGGKGPLIIFSDAQLDQAVEAVCLANFYSTGQICSNGTRVFVQKNIAEKFKKALIERAQKIKVGDPMLSETEMGPLISQDQKDKVLGYLEGAKKQGAQFLLDGADREALYFGPTILDGLNDQMSIVQEEVFGPVLCLLEFEHEDEVIERSNATPFGLAGGVFTQNIQRAHRVANKIQCGVCWINNYNITPIEIPFGGLKMSGLGLENGHEVFKEYSLTKVVYVEGGENAFGF